MNAPSRGTLVLASAALLLASTSGCGGMRERTRAAPAPRRGTPPPVTLPRLAGDRYEVGASVAATLFPDGAGTVVIASADEGSFERGQLAAAVAGVLSRPLLFTETATLPRATADALRSLGATRAIIVGGENAVSGAVERQVAAMGLDTSRVGGDDIHEDSRAVAKAVRDLWGAARYDGKVFLVPGDPVDWRVLYAVSSAAYGGGVPVLFAGRRGLPDETEAAMDELGAKKVVVLGDEGLISGRVIDRLARDGREVVRLPATGPDDYGPVLAEWVGDNG